MRDTLFYMNGEIVATHILDTSFMKVTFKDPKDTVKIDKVDEVDLFAIKYYNGLIIYYYQQDTTIADDYTREEMWLYMQGERDAKKGFKARGSLIGSFITGVAGGLTGNFVAAVGPFAYMGLSGITKIRIKHSTVSNPYYLDHSAYILGYERKARGRRRVMSLIGGGIGLAVGYSAYFIFIK